MRTKTSVTVGALALTFGFAWQRSSRHPWRTCRHVAH